MIWILITAFVVVVSTLIAKHLLHIENNKYKDNTYLSNLSSITLFFDTIKRFDDYVTWVQRDKIKTNFLAVGQYFKGKSMFYKKEKNTIKLK